MKIPPETKIVSFALNGALLDWGWGVQQVLQGYLNDIDDYDTDIELFHGKWEDYQRQLMLSKPFMDYKTIVRDALKRLLGDYENMTYSDDLGEKMVADMRQWMPFMGVKGQLTRIRTKYPIALLANNDNDVLETLLAAVGAEFDHVISSEDLQTYKPSRDFFEKALEKIQAQPHEVFHVSNSLYYDLSVAQDIGITTCWINRDGHGLGDARQPSIELHDMHMLPDLLEIAPGG